MKKTKFKFFAAIVISFAFLISVILVCRCFKPSGKYFEPVLANQSKIESTSTEKPMIGVWVPFMDLAINDPANTEKKFKNKFDDIVRTAKQNKANTLIVHVRSHGDAMYKSKYFPWSHFLTGIQGQDPGFDPLEYMVKTCHDNDLKIHAWINPLRIKFSTNPNTLCQTNPYFNFDSKKQIIKSKGNLYYNPSYPEVRELIANGIKEIVQNYDVDAIHIDDYFYLETDCEVLKQFEGISKKEAVNLLIKKIYSTIKETKPNVEFGISPAGNLKKCDKIGADIQTWIENPGYADYICPQIYWSTDFEIMPFENTAKTWKALFKKNNNKIKLYCGLALYKAGREEFDGGTWKNKNDILANEFKICKNLNFDGIMIYAWNHLKSSKAKPELENLLHELG